MGPRGRLARPISSTPIRIILATLVACDCFLEGCRGFALLDVTRSCSIATTHLSAWSGSSNYLDAINTAATLTAPSSSSNEYSRYDQPAPAVETVTFRNGAPVFPPYIQIHQEPLTPTQNEQEEEQPNRNSMEQEDYDRYLKMVSTEVQLKKLLGQNPYALTDIPLKVILGRFLDSLEDDFVSRNGEKKGQNKFRGQTEPLESRPTVIVLGTGWAAHAFVKLASNYDLRVVVVSPVNHFVRNYWRGANDFL